jgi:adenylylsulfate kinase
MQRTIWITGLSGAGKSTLGIEVVRLLRSNGESVVYLDGDQLREVFSAVNLTEKNHSREGRLSLAMQYSRLCDVISKQGLTVVIATISMFKEIHDWNRKNLPNYFEVFLKVPMTELQFRDPKNIYSRYNSGELINVAGLDLNVDEPVSPDLLFDFREMNTAKQMADKIISVIQE